MKRLIPVIFILTAAALALLFFSRNLFVNDTSISRAKVVIPIVGDTGSGNDANEYSDSLEQSSFIQLSNGETLVGTLEMDIDGDGADDQINMVKTSASPYIVLIVGLYEPKTGSYIRSNYIATQITQMKTFACTSIDVLGNHKNALVYQGTMDSGTVVLKIFMGARSKSGEFILTPIGDFEADGTIFIQQTPRSESYELSQTKGDSFPVWVYTSEQKNVGSDSSQLDQIQTMYDWDENEGAYVAVRTLRVAGNRVAAKELARIQDGTVATFGKFLDGLWYKTENTGSSIRFISFDYPNAEIIFEYEDSEEVYSWLKSTLRRNGIYFSAVNKSIENLQRRFDISLVSTDEIKIKLQDDVRMLINESTLWDGNYKKFISREQKNDPATKESECIARLIEQGSWETTDNTILNFTESTYVAKGSVSYDSGRFTSTEISGTTLIQFRSMHEVPFFKGAYIPSFQDGKDRDTILLQYAVISPEGFYQDSSAPVLLRKYIPPKDDETSPVEEIQSFVQSEVAQNSKEPKLSVGISPQYFSPDGDGEYDDLTIMVKAECDSPMKNWSFTVEDPATLKPFWTAKGTTTLQEKIIWNGRSARGEVVQSATDYPYEFTVTDSNNLSSTIKGFVKVDVLVIREGERIKIQVPSIIFRSDAADFKTTEELMRNPNYDGKTLGLDNRTLENNVKVLGRVSEILKKFRDYSVQIEGNANNLSGTQQEEDEVKLLSEQRAQYVRDWLIKDGVSASNLKAVGNGSKNPATLSTALEDRWKNRRVEFILKK
ncbi:MAG: pallilysin-related adhesin [Treponema sp.]|uniref:pallilysin-related adhesin n=1 Tax=Treponema sp. TaxID=166 RepID=UPI0025DFD7FF|nr:pallilysin-related adhesin [Treponema sp.]MBQ9282779.1 pallilysin-related adhesin [Treponema sp.]